jgi:hypothetical protein
MVNEKQLRKAAAELNDVMGLEPKINTKASVAVLTAGIVEAIDKIDPDDEFSEATRAVIEELSAEEGKPAPKKGKGKGKPAPKKKKPVYEDDDDFDDDVNDDILEDLDDLDDFDDDDDEPAPKKGKGKGKPAPKKKKPVYEEEEEEEDDVFDEGEEFGTDEEEEEEDEKPTPKKKKKTGAPSKGTKPNFKREGSMAQFMDETVKKGGTWDEIFNAIDKEAKKRGVKTSMSTIKAHVRFRVSKDPRFLGKLKVTDDGIE